MGVLYAFADLNEQLQSFLNLQSFLIAVFRDWQARHVLHHEGTDFMGFRVPRPVKTALISREDNPSLTAWRIRHLFSGKQPDNPELFAENLYINTGQHSKQLLLDNYEQMAELVGELRMMKPEFVILDVLNVLHTRDENDNQEMRQVLARLEEIQREIGCGIGLCHHYNKMGNGSMTQRMRGSSAIA